MKRNALKTRFWNNFKCPVLDRKCIHDLQIWPRDLSVNSVKCSLGQHSWSANSVLQKFLAAMLRANNRDCNFLWESNINSYHQQLCCLTLGQFPTYLQTQSNPTVWHFIWNSEYISLQRGNPRTLLWLQGWFCVRLRLCIFLQKRWLAWHSNRISKQDSLPLILRGNTNRSLTSL